MTTGLVIVDIQNDYFPGGQMSLEGSLQAASQAQRLLGHFRSLGLPVIHVQHISKGPGATFFLPGSGGIEIHESVRPLPREPVVVKHYPNGFRDTLLLHRLLEADVRRLVLAGMMTHMCVDATVRAAADFGFQVIVVEDACATRALTHGETSVPAAHVQAAFLAAFKSYGSLMSTDEVISRLGAEQTH